MWLLLDLIQINNALIFKKLIQIDIPQLRMNCANFNYMQCWITLWFWNVFKSDLIE